MFLDLDGFGGALGDLLVIQFQFDAQVVAPDTTMPGLPAATAAATSAAPATTEAAAATTEAAKTDIMSEAARISKLAKDGLVFAAADSGTASTDIVAQTGWLGPESTPAPPKGKKLDIIICAPGTACETAANFAKAAAEKIGWTAEIVPGAGTPESFNQAFDTAIANKPDVIMSMAIPDVAVGASLAKAKAARGAPPFDAFVLDPGPRITAIEAGLFDKFDGKKLTNASKLPPGFIDEWGVCVNAQVVGIAYNPKKVPAPKGWKDLLTDQIGRAHV